MDYYTKPVKRTDLRSYSVFFRYLFGVENDSDPFPVIKALEKVPDVFKGTVFSILEDADMPANVPAKCYPDSAGNFTIEIKNSVYEGARKHKIGAYLGFICHEICHVFLYKIGYTPIIERSFDNNEIVPYCSVEWQAKALCGEVMMPYEATKEMSVEEIIKKYTVSKGFASYRKKY